MSSRFQARYFDGQQLQSYAVTVRFDAFHLHISHDDLHLQWRYDDVIVIDKKGHGMASIIGHKKLTDARLSCDDPKFYEALRPYLPGHNALLKRFWTENRPLVIGTLSTALCVALLVIGLRIGARHAANYVPDSVSANLGELVQREVLKKYPPCAETQNTREIKAILDRLSPHLQAPLTLNLRVVKHKMPNAMAAPGGYIIVFEGLIKQAETPEEVAGVLAHEIGHVEYRHGLQGMINQLGMSVIITALLGGSGGETMASLGAGLLNQDYSRDLEREADAYAVTMLQKAAIDPRYFAEFFNRISKKRKDSNGAIAYLSSHPPDAERIASIHQLRQKDAPVKPIMAKEQWQAFQKSLCQSAPKKRIR